MNTLYDVLEKNGDKKIAAVRFKGKETDYPSAIKNVKKLAQYLKNAGVSKGDTVTVVLPNVPLAVWTFYALDYLGVRQNIIHPLTPLNQIIKSAETTGSKAIILLATLYGENEEIFAGLPYIFLFANPMEDVSFFMRKAFWFKYKKPKETGNIRLIDGYKRTKPTAERDSLGENDTCILLSSGGTTGNPKMIELSAAAINALAAKTKAIINYPAEGQSMLAVLPMFHGFGLGMGVHTPVYHGACVSLMMKFDVKEVVGLINKNKLNMIIGVPVLYRKLLDDEGFRAAKLSNLRYCFIGGDNVHTSLIEEFNETLKASGGDGMVLEGYGLTETVTVCTVNTKEEFRLGSVGKPLEGIEVEVLKEDGSLASPGELGELYVYGDTEMNGYYKDPTTTAVSVVERNGKKWIKTWDLGYKDEDGFIFLKGRMRRMFKISGMNVFPIEVEKIATDNDDVYDAALEYFETPKPHTVLFLLRNKYGEKTDDEIKAEVMKDLEGKVLKYSLPQKIVILDEFPKTDVGKTDHAGFKD